MCCYVFGFGKLGRFWVFSFFFFFDEFVVRGEGLDV